MRHERQTMILISPDEEPTGLTTSINSLERQLADMRADLKETHERIRTGEFGELKNATRVTAAIRQWLKISLEAEVQLEKRRKRGKGIAYDFALDLDEARASIGSRLDRLRRAGNGT